MGMAEYLARDLELLDDPDLAEDSDDYARDLAYFAALRAEDKAARRAARAAKKKKAAEHEAGAMEGVEQVGGDDGAAGRELLPAERSHDGWAGETSFVDETRFLDGSPQRQSCPSPASPASMPAGADGVLTVIPSVCSVAVATANRSSSSRRRLRRRLDPTLNPQAHGDQQLPHSREAFSRRGVLQHVGLHVVAG